MRVPGDIWLWYAATVVAMVVLTAVALEPRVPVLGSVLVHGGIAATAAVLSRRVDARGAWLWGVFTLVALPMAFSAPALVLPALNPEAWEWRWIAVDRWLCGGDPTVLLQPLVTSHPLAVEVLQLCYATFYFLPIALLWSLLRGGRFPAYWRCLRVITFVFLLSYLAYHLFPTLPPYRFLVHEEELRGALFADRVHRLLDVLEANRFDCFPSGHTMLTLVTLRLAWTEARRLFWPLLVVGAPLVVATVALRYHYLIDVLVGAALVPVAMALAARTVAVTPPPSAARPATG